MQSLTTEFLVLRYSPENVSNFTRLKSQNLGFARCLVYINMNLIPYRYAKLVFIH